MSPLPAILWSILLFLKRKALFGFLGSQSVLDQFWKGESQRRSSAQRKISRRKVLSTRHQATTIALFYGLCEQKDLLLVLAGATRGAGAFQRTAVRGAGCEIEGQEELRQNQNQMFREQSAHGAQRAHRKGDEKACRGRLALTRTRQLVPHVEGAVKAKKKAHCGQPALARGEQSFDARQRVQDSPHRAMR
jgi:hypothetical protein